MAFPRVSRMLLAALVILASIATPDLICAEHGGHDASAPAGTKHTGGNDHDHGPAAPADPCDQPALPSCCPLLMACSLSLAAGEAETTLLGEEGARAPSARWAGILLSRITPPDPPPPKA